MPKTITKKTALDFITHIAKNPDLMTTYMVERLEQYIRQTPTEVAPLSFRRHDSVCIIANTIMGNYMVERHDPVSFTAWLPNDNDGQSTTRRIDKVFDTQENAIGYCNREHEKRVKGLMQ